MKVGDLVEYKTPGLDDGIAVITKVRHNHLNSTSLSYGVEVTWQNGQTTAQYNWQMKKVSNED
jgi:hypothetical protein